MIGDRRVLAIVPARAGSQGLPGKNLKSLAGRPMIEWTLAAAQASQVIDRLVVSTDDQGVAALAASQGVEVVSRPPELAGPTASVIDAVDHVLATVGGAWDYVVLLQPTSPLRIAADIDGAVTMCDQTGAPSVIAVSPMLKPPGFYGRIDAGGVYRKSSTEADEIVLINGAVYVGRPDVLKRDRGFQSVGTRAWTMPPERGWDVDTLFDFMICETLSPYVQAGEDLGGVRR